MTYEIDNRAITVRFDCPGIHSYPAATENHGGAVKFLEYPHRHKFKFEVTVPVSHAERDLEFFLLRDYCFKAVQQSYPTTTMYVNFESRSCETIAYNLGQEVLDHFETVDWCMITVSEDGESDATITMSKPPKWYGP